jgi:hypothetical protein
VGVRVLNQHPSQTGVEAARRVVRTTHVALVPTVLSLRLMARIRDIE